MNGNAADEGSFGLRLRLARERKGLTQAELAQKCELAKSSIQNFESGRLPAGHSLRALCEILEASADWLIFGRDGGMSPRADSDHGTGPVEIGRGPGVPDRDSGESQSGEYRLVPLMEAFLSAGGGSFVHSEKASKFLAFRRDWLNGYASAQENVLLMNVIGNSMSPLIEDGDLVMVDTGRQHVHDGAIYAIGLGETIAVKRLKRLVTGNRVSVISENRNEYPPQEVDLGDLRILGQVIWYAREMIR